MYLCNAFPYRNKASHPHLSQGWSVSLPINFPPGYLLLPLSLNINNKIKVNEYRLNYATLFNNRTHRNNQQSTFTFWGEVINTVFYPFYDLLSSWYHHEQNNTNIFYLTILKLNLKLPLTNHILDIPQHITPHPSDSSLPRPVVHISNCLSHF